MIATGLAPRAVAATIARTALGGGMLRGMLDPGDWLGMKPALNPAASPLALRHVPDSGEAKLRIGVGAGVLLAAAFVAWLFRDDGFVVFVACGFAAFALANLAYGVMQTGFEKSLLIDGGVVSVKTRTLLGRREWREPLDSYRGVRLRERHLRRGAIGDVESTKTYHIVELAHADPSRTLPLYVRADGPPPRDVQEAFARRFGLPALSPDGSGEIARAPGALARGLAQAAPRDPGPPPSGVAVSRSGDEIRIAVGPGRRWLAFAKLFWLALPLLFGGFVFLLDPVMGLVAGGMAALFVLLILGLGRLMGGGEEAASSAVVVDAGTIRIEHPRRARLRRLPAGPERRLRRDAVEQVRVDSYASHSSRNDGQPIHHARLLIEADSGRLELIAGQFDGGKLEWVRDYLAGVVLPATTPSSPSASAAPLAAGPPR